MINLSQNFLSERKLLGIAFLIITIFVIIMALTGTSVEDRDATFALISGPLSLYLLFKK